MIMEGVLSNSDCTLIGIKLTQSKDSSSFSHTEDLILNFSNSMQMKRIPKRVSKIFCLNMFFGYKK